MKIKQKLTAILITSIMVGSNLLSFGNQVIASADEIEKQNSKTNHANVEFNSYFEGNVHEKTFSIQDGGKMYISLKINENGYLKNGIVEFSNGNYELNSDKIQSEHIQKIENQSIYLQQIHANKEFLLEIPFSLQKQATVDKNIFNKDSQVIFKGTYIDGTGKEKTIEKTITNRVKWQAQAQIELNGEITKYLPYQVGEEYGVFVQAKINSGIKENIVPIYKTNIEVTVPTINELTPERISVIANNTKATNGLENGTNFVKDNYYYDSENAKIIIQANNEVNSQGKIAWGQGKDEYLVTYIYTGKEVYDLVKEQLKKAEQTKLTEEEKQEGKQNENAIQGNLTVTANFSVYQADEKQIETEANLPYTIEEAKGELTDFNLITTNNISKGYIYANYAKTEKENAKQVIEDKKETVYELTYNAQIYDIALNQQIILESNAENLVAESEYEVGKNIITKQLKIQEAIFQKILGQEGKIEITTKEGTSLGNIDTTTAKDEEGNYILDISDKKINEIIIKTSAPITEGMLEIKIQKAFITEQSYSEKQMKSFEKLVVQMTGKTIANTKTLSKEINMNEPVSKAQISIEEGKERLSTITTNKDVEIKVELDTSSIENALYKNPKIEIQMPSQVKKVEIKDANLLLDDELKIKETKVISQNGKQIIQIILEGTQTKYQIQNITSQQQNNVISKGANIILETDITIDPLTPSKQEEIRMYYTNENTNLYEENYQIQTSSETQEEILNTVGSTYVTTDVEKTTITVGTSATPVNLVAPTGVAAAHKITGYNAEGSEILSIDGEKSQGKLEIYAQEKTVTVQGIVTNNYTNSIENVLILGRLPFKGNKAIDENTELGSNFNIPMISQITTTGIDTSKVKIYYSTNGEATKDLSNTANNWTETPNNLSEVKSYLIVVSEEVVANTQFTFSYQVELPANLSYNNSSYTSYKVYYNNKTQEATIAETKTAGTLELTTGQGPELEVTLTSNIKENEVVRNKQYVRFFVNVKNKGTVDAENVKIIIDGNKVETVLDENGNEVLDENGNIMERDATKYYIVDFAEDINTYTMVEGNKKEISLGNIKVNETKQTEYEVQINFLNEYEENTEKAKIENKVNASADNMEKQIQSNTYILEGKLGNLEIINKVNTLESKIYDHGYNVEYRVQLTNLEENDLTNITVTIPLPNDVEITNAVINSVGGETKEGIQILENKIVVTIPQIKASTYQTINVNFTIGKQTDKKFSTKVEAKQGENTYYSNERYINVGELKIEGTQLKVEKNYIKEGEKYSYNFTIKSTGTSNIYDFVLEDNLPEEVSYLEPLWNSDSNLEPPVGTDVERGVKITIVGDEETSLVKHVYVEEQILTIKIPVIPSNTTLQIKIYVEANLPDNVEEKQVTNTAKMYAKNVSEINLNSVTHYIEYDPQKHQETPEKQGRYKITGTAWLDENQNGTRDENENLLEGIKVLLVYKSNSQMVKDVDNNTQKIQTTNSKGKYEFSNLTQGEYLVIFLYDSGKYSITQYQKEGVSQSYNSDATSMKIVLDGKQTYAGVTDTIKIINGNGRSIDIGLFTAQKFDLKLDKYIRKITLTTPTIGTKQYSYTNSQLEKIEILGRNVNKSSIVVEYKIVVTNQGQIAGYARKIIDYLPEDAKFSSEINSNWYISDNNQNVYNASLAETIIKPGESKEVTLVLSFNITDKNIGNIINNNAEIYESYNEQGVIDIDSIEANKLESEDDISKADVLLSIVTGNIVLYTSLAVAILSLVIISIIIIRKKILKQN